MAELAYFAYGSNINITYLKHYLEACRCSPAGLRNEQHATLHGYCFRTNVLTESSGGAANIEVHEGSTVEGVVMEITPDILKVLREKEDYPTGYREIPVRVEVSEPNCKHVDTFTYVVTPKFALPFDQPVSIDYRHIILAGSQHFEFSEHYRQFLRDKLVPFVKHRKIRLMPG